MKFQIVLLFILSELCFSQSLDPTFGINGIVTSQLSNAPTNDIVTTAVMQPDGKTVMAGLNTTLYRSNSIIVRTNPNGSLDTNFNAIGYRTFSGLGFEAVALQNDGKIIVAGQDKAYRLNSDGSIDYEFGTDGFVKLYFGNNKWMTIKSIATLNNKIIFGGYSRGSNGEFKFTIVQLNSDGSFDTTFDDDGKAILFETTGSSDLAYALKIQNDNKIILTGQTIDGVTTDDNFLTVRINPDGSLDSTFGSGGKVMTSFATGNDYGRNLEIQNDGKILVIGSNNNRYAVARYNTDGSLDTSFDSDGKLYLTTNLSLFISSSQTIYDRPNIKVLPSGKILLSGTSNYNFSLIRLNQNGSFDTTFGTNGLLYYSVNVRNRSSYLFLNNENKIITGGSSHNNTGGNVSKINQLQFSENGLLENSSNFNIQLGISRVSNAIEQADGKIIVLCENRTSSDDAIFIRYLSNGSIDTSFGNNGISTIGQGLLPDKMIQLNNGKLAVYFYNSPLLKMYNPDGTVDNTYGTNGSINIGQLITTASFIKSVKSAPDGSVFIACSTNSVNFGVIKVLSNGIIDSSFGNNGIATVDFDLYTTTDIESPNDLLILPNGKIIIIGSLRFSSQIMSAGVACLNVNGTLDTTFGSNGKIIIQNGSYTSPGKLINLENDEFIVGYFSSDLNQHDYRKYFSNGTLDNDFSISFTENLDGLYSSTVLPNGKFLLAGKKKHYDNGEFLIVRYNSDGSLDTTFGSNGEYVIPVLNGSAITDLISLADGKLLASGFANNATHVVCAMAKISNETLDTPYFENADKEVILYPNPIHEEATLTYQLNENESITIEIFDLNGKLIQTITSHQLQNKGIHQDQIKLNDSIVEGEYILRILRGNQAESLKFIKAN